MSDVFQIKIGEGTQHEFETHPDTTVLYRFMGHYAVYDCLKTTLEDDNGPLVAWSFLVNVEEQYVNELTGDLLQHGYECKLDLEHVPKEIQDEYDKLVTLRNADPDHVPEDWT